MESLSRQKETLRGLFKERRSAIAARRRYEAEKETLSLLNKLTSFTMILSYVAKEEELSLALLNETLKLEGRLALPRLSPAKIVPKRATGELELGPFAVWQPPESAPLAEIDCALIPALSYDEEGNRLGWGKGYYDKFLALHQIFTLGVIFKEQLSPALLPAEPHDKKVDELCLF